MTSSCEHGNQPSVLMKGCDLLAARLWRTVLGGNTWLELLLIFIIVCAECETVRNCVIPRNLRFNGAPPDGSSVPEVRPIQVLQHSMSPWRPAPLRSQHGL